jgi:hypothetical protein
MPPYRLKHYSARKGPRAPYVLRGCRSTSSYPSLRQRNRRRAPITHAAGAAVAERKKGQRRQPTTRPNCADEEITRNPTVPVLVGSRILAASIGALRFSVSPEALRLSMRSLGYACSLKEPRIHAKSQPRCRLPHFPTYERKRSAPTYKEESCDRNNSLDTRL